MAKKKLENLNFEQAIDELENIVTHLEQGDLSLEESMSLFERGLSLSKHSQEKLSAAEQKIDILLQDNNQHTLEEFTLGETPSE